VAVVGNFILRGMREGLSSEWKCASLSGIGSVVSDPSTN